MRRPLLVLLFPVLVMLTSGCTIPGTGIELPFPDPFGGGGDYTDDILAVTSFSATPDTVFPGQTIRLTAYIENTGDNMLPLQDQGDVVVDLYDYCPGLFEFKDVSCPSGEPIESASNPGCSFSKLHPGQTVEVTWRMVPKDVQLKTVCPSDGMKMRARYSYSTTTVMTVNFMSEDEMNRQLSSGTFRNTRSYTTRGPGPVKAFLEVKDDQPVPMIDGQGEATMEMIIRNTGTGFVPSTESEGDTYHIPYDSLDIRGQDSGLDVKCEEDYPFKLIRDETPSRLCTVSYSGDIDTEYTGYVIAELNDYPYEIRDSTLVTVERRITQGSDDSGPDLPPTA